MWGSLGMRWNLRNPVIRLRSVIAMSCPSRVDLLLKVEQAQGCAGTAGRGGGQPRAGKLAHRSEHGALVESEIVFGLRQSHG